MFSVAGNTAIVTGGSSGICFSFATLLLSRGCNVVIADLALRAETRDLLSTYKTGTPRAVFVSADVTSWTALSHVFDTALQEFGDFGIVCPGAGVYEPHWSSFWHPPGSPESKDAIDSDGYRILDINLTHPLRVAQMALSHWFHPRHGAAKPSAGNPKRIVHISSVAGQRPNFNAPLYSVPKHGISGFVRSMARLDQSHHVRVTAVAPGIVRTPLWTEDPEKLIVLDTEQDGWVTPGEVVEAMVRCAEDEGVRGGAIVEVGKNRTRFVEAFNDPGPSLDPSDGLVPRSSGKAVDLTMSWISDDKIWGPVNLEPNRTT